MISYISYIETVKWWYFIGVAMMFISVPLFEFLKTKKISVFILVLGVFLINVFFINADPFLHLWDEQFHALVAKNMTENPFYPYLVSIENLPAVTDSWVSCHLWLHKHPAFLWLMALSIKIFGASYWSIRLPSALLSALMIFAIYGIGRRIANRRVGYWASLFFAISQVYVPLLSGRLNTDHNDAVFAAFVLFSIYFFIRYLEVKNIKNLILISVFVALAVLTKWLVGILVFSAWGIYIISDSNIRNKISSYYHIGFAFIISVAIVLPWHLYSYYSFPVMYVHEFEAMSIHYTTIVEGHGESWNFFINGLDKYVANGFAIISIISLLLFVSPLVKIANRFKLIIPTYILFIFVFFSFSATKMPMFTYPVYPLIMIVVAAAFYFFTNYIMQRYFSKVLIKIAFVFIPLLMSFYLFNTNNFAINNPDWQQYRWRHHVVQNEIYLNLKDLIIEESSTNKAANESMVFNFPAHGHIRFDFVTGIDARRFMPSLKEINILEESNIDIFVFNDGKIPNYILENKRIKIVESDLFLENSRSAIVRFSVK